jgi:hypothetical protein
MGYVYSTGDTYVSNVCSSKKKAEEHKIYIEDVMKKGGEPWRVYWVYDARVV